MSYLEVAGNDLHFTNHSDFQQTIKVFSDNNIPYEIFDSCVGIGTIDKCVIVDRQNEAFKRLNIGLTNVTEENVIKVKLRKIRYLINETIEVRERTPFCFSVRDEYLAHRAGYLRKQEIELLEKLEQLKQ